MKGPIERLLSSNDASLLCRGYLAVRAFPFHLDRVKGIVTTDGRSGFPEETTEEEFHQLCVAKARELDKEGAGCLC